MLCVMSHWSHFQQLMTHRLTANFITAMCDYRFPSVKCPADCFAFVDECQTVNSYTCWHGSLTYVYLRVMQPNSEEQVMNWVTHQCILTSLLFHLAQVVSNKVYLIEA